MFGTYVWDVFGICLRNILDMFETCSEQNGWDMFRKFLGHVWDKCRTCVGRVTKCNGYVLDVFETWLEPVAKCLSHRPDMFGACLGLVWDAFGTRLKCLQCDWKVLEDVLDDNRGIPSTRISILYEYPYYMYIP